VFLEAVKGKEFSNFIANPFVPKKNRIENITPMLHKMGFCKTSLGFVKALIAKNRLKGAPVVFSKVSGTQTWRRVCE
jgi:F0F1-type ATP synthase delta subunit